MLDQHLDYQQHQQAPHRRRAQQPSIKAAIAQLQGLVDAKRRECEALAAQRRELDLRRAALAVVGRALHEIGEHRRRVGGGGGSAGASDAAPEDEEQAEVLGQLLGQLMDDGGGGGGGDSSRPSSGAEPWPDSVFATLPHVAAAAAAAVDADGGGGCGCGAGGLLHLGCAGDEEIRAIREGSLEAFKERMAGLIRGVLALQAGGDGDGGGGGGDGDGVCGGTASPESCAAAPPAAAAAAPARARRLAAAGRRLQRALSLVSLEAYGSFVGFQSTMCAGPARVCSGLDDAPLTHWEAAVRAARITRRQAELMVEIGCANQRRLDALRGERLALMRQLCALGPLPDAPEAARAAAAAAAEAAQSTAAAPGAGGAAALAAAAAAPPAPPAPLQDVSALIPQLLAALQQNGASEDSGSGADSSRGAGPGATATSAAATSAAATADCQPRAPAQAPPAPRPAVAPPVAELPAAVPRPPQAQTRRQQQLQQQQEQEARRQQAAQQQAAQQQEAQLRAPAAADPLLLLLSLPEALEASMRAERAVIALFANAFFAVLTAPQQARVRGALLPPSALHPLPPRPRLLVVHAPARSPRPAPPASKPTPSAHPPPSAPSSPDLLEPAPRAKPDPRRVLAVPAQHAQGLRRARLRAALPAGRLGARRRGGGRGGGGGRGRLRRRRRRVRGRVNGAGTAAPFSFALWPLWLAPLTHSLSPYPLFIGYMAFTPSPPPPQNGRRGNHPTPTPPSSQNNPTLALGFVAESCLRGALCLLIHAALTPAAL